MESCPIKSGLVGLLEGLEELARWPTFLQATGHLSSSCPHPLSPQTLPASRQDSLTNPMPALYFGMSLEKQTSGQPGTRVWSEARETLLLTEREPKGGDRRGHFPSAETIRNQRTCQGTWAVRSHGHWLEVRKSLFGVGQGTESSEPQFLHLSGVGCFRDVWDVVVAVTWWHTGPTPGQPPPPPGNLGQF